MGLSRDYRFQAGPRIVHLRNPLAFGMTVENRELGVNRQQPPQASRERSTRRKVFGAIVGGVGGFFGGMFLGAAIEGDGGVIGYKLLF
jgi:hypothetical protein